MSATYAPREELKELPQTPSKKILRKLEQRVSKLDLKYLREQKGLALTPTEKRKLNRRITNKVQMTKGDEDLPERTEVANVVPPSDELLPLKRKLEALEEELTKLRSNPPPAKVTTAPPPSKASIKVTFPDLASKKQFLDWRFDFEAWLSYHNIRNFFEGNLPEATNSMVYSVLVTKVRSSTLRQAIRKVKTGDGRQLYETLHKECISTRGSYIANLLTKMFQLRCKNMSGYAEYQKAFQASREWIAAADIHLPEKAFAAMYIAGITCPSFTSSKQSILASIHEDSLTVDHIASCIEDVQNQRETSGTSNQHGGYKRRYIPNGRKPNPTGGPNTTPIKVVQGVTAVGKGKPPKCYICASTTHLQRDCPKNKNKQIK